jgi:hypothetical protein
MRARNREGIGLSERPARLHRLAESFPWNRLLGSIKFKNTASASLQNNTARHSFTLMHSQKQRRPGLYYCHTVVYCTDVLKGLSHEMDLAFDELQGTVEDLNSVAWVGSPVLQKENFGSSMLSSSLVSASRKSFIYVHLQVLYFLHKSSIDFI